MKHRILVIIVLIFSAYSICACGTKSQTKLFNRYNTVNLTDEENSELIKEILYFIEDTGNGTELKMFDDDLTIDKEDILTGIGIKDKKYYISSNAAYLQIDKYIYRFQFNSSNKIISYIKYTVEA